MKALLFSFLLICFTASSAKLVHHKIAQTLCISEEIAQRIIERIEYIDQLNRHHAPYYPILSQVFFERSWL